MNRLRSWLETHVPSMFQHVEKVERIEVAGVELTLRDWEGSSVLAIVPKEILDDDYRLSTIEFRPGDVVVTPVTGAYGYAMASNYNGIPRPPVILCSRGEARAVVRRETYEDLHGRDV